MITPVPQQQDGDLVHTEKSSPCGNLNGREVKTINNLKGEALKTSSVFYLIAAFVLLLGVSVSIIDKNWTTGIVVISSGVMIGLLGSRVHKEILNHEETRIPEALSENPSTSVIQNN